MSYNVSINKLLMKTQNWKIEILNCQMNRKKQLRLLKMAWIYN